MLVTGITGMPVLPGYSVNRQPPVMSAMIPPTFHQIRGGNCWSPIPEGTWSRYGGSMDPKEWRGSVVGVRGSMV